MPSSEHNEEVADAHQTLDVLQSISELMGNRLDKEILSVCMTLIQMGVNPEALAQSIKELQKEKMRMSKEC